jgi:hypothetical protein
MKIRTEFFTRGLGLICLATATAACAVPQLIRGPYLQVSTPSGIIIRWRTDVPDGSQVVYGSDLVSMTLTNNDPATVTEHQVLVTNLQPDMVYYYAVGSEARMLAGFDTNCYFRTHPLPGTPKPLHLWVIGDAGTGDVNQEAVRNAFYNLNGTNYVDAWLQLGDNAYEFGLDEEYQVAVFNMYSNLLAHTITWPTIGNHETYSTDPNGLYAHLNVFSMPTSGEAGGVPSSTKLYYSFDIGMVHFICLDSMISSRAPGDPMAVWLAADLASTTNRWLIAYWHHPPYSKGSHDSDKDVEMIEMRQNILPILEAGGVDLVLAGHSHSYERSYLLNGHYGFSTNLTPAMIVNGSGGRNTNGSGAYVKPEHAVGNPVGNQGTVYAVAGSAGHISGLSAKHPAMFIALNVLGSMVLDITTDRMDAIFLRETGATNDWFTIIKTNFAPVATNLMVNVEADTPTNLLLAACDLNRNPITFATCGQPTNGLLSGFDSSCGALTYTPAHGSTNQDVFRFTASDGRLVSVEGVVIVNVLPASDTNQNGLPDVWEAMYGVTDPNADPDGDGVANILEYRAGTNPTNALSWLQITGINRGQSGFQVVWSAVGGTRYRILYSDGDRQTGFNGVFNSLPRPAAEEIYPIPVGSPGTMSFTDDFSLTGGPPPHGTRYFRAQVIN